MRKWAPEMLSVVRGWGFLGVLLSKWGLDSFLSWVFGWASVGLAASRKFCVRRVKAAAIERTSRCLGCCTLRIYACAGQSARGRARSKPSGGRIHFAGSVRHVWIAPVLWRFGGYAEAGRASWRQRSFISQDSLSGARALFTRFEGLRG